MRGKATLTAAVSGDWAAAGTVTNFTRRNFTLATLVISMLAAAIGGLNAQTLGRYPDAVVYAGGNTAVTFSEPNSFAARTVETSTDFKGVLTLSSSTDTVNVTNAQPAGIYTVTVKGFLPNTMPATKTFTLRVLRLGCSGFTASNFTPLLHSPFTTRPSPQMNAIFDWENDGDQDIAVGCFTAHPNVTLLRNTIDISNSNNFSTNNIPNLNVNTQRAQGIAVADFDASGNADVLVSHPLNNSVAVLLNNHGTFEEVRNFTVGANPRGVVAGDWNNDGYPDFAVANSGNSTVSVFLRSNVDGAFTEAAGSPVSIGTDIFGIARGDFNRDGNQDLAVPSAFEFQEMHILLGSGNGTFTEAPNSPFFIGVAARYVVVADFNNDGFQDLLTDNYGGFSITLLVGDGSGGFTASTVPVDQHSIGIAAADLNGDGNQDFLLSYSQAPNDTKTGVFLGDGAGNFTAAGVISSLSGPGYISIGDFNGDEFLDAAISESGASRLAVRLGSCETRITNAGPTLPDGQQSAAYSQQITVSSPAPYSFSATGLPPGLTISSDGLISGTPTASGTFIVTVTATQTGASGPGDQTFKQFQLTITAPTVETSAVSRKTHGMAGTFDVELPLLDTPGVECRSSGGAHTLVFTFTNNVVSGTAEVTSGVGNVSSSPTFATNTMTVNLTGVADVQKITVTLSGVTDSSGQVLPNTAVSMNMLIGDINASKTVNASDIGAVKAQSGLPVTTTNFRADVAVSGGITASDIGLVKSRSGASVP